MKSIEAEIIRSMVERMGDGADAPARLPTPIQARNLRDMLQEVLRPNPFKIGDLVVQRKNASRYRWPDDGEVAIVTLIAGENEYVQDEPGAQRDNTFTRQDMVVLCNITGGTWIEYPVESWRFDHYAGEVDAS